VIPLALPVGTTLPSPAEVEGVRLLVTDLDGTLLDDEHRVDPAFWELADRFAARGVVLAAASGRQRATIVETFGDRLADMALICDNGALAELRGRELRAVELAPDVVAEVVRGVRALGGLDRPLAIALSARAEVWVEGDDRSATDPAAAFFHAVSVVDDVLAPASGTLKVSVYDPAGVGPDMMARLRELAPGHAVVQGHDLWADVTADGVDKGVALRRVQAELGVTREQTLAFGDHHNDVGLLQAAGLSFAMANAQPGTAAVARFRAPANTEQGVVRVLAALLDLVEG
jgi:Cof subfamily protein (haloacid dehalogenase superfamily)